MTWWPEQYETERDWASACAVAEGWEGTVEDYMEGGFHRPLGHERRKHVVLTTVCLPPLPEVPGSYDLLARRWMRATVAQRQGGLTQSLQGAWHNLTDNERRLLRRRWDCDKPCTEETRRCTS